MKKIILMVLLLSIGSATFATRITIQTQPQDARIFVGGQEVGQGTAQVTLPRHGTVMVRVEAIGFYPRDVRIGRDQARRGETRILRLDFNDALYNSFGEETALIANRWVDVPIRAGMSDDEAWRRLVAAVQRDFEDIEMRDRSALVIRTNWVSQRFLHETVRTRLEIRPDFSQAEGTGVQVRLSSEVRWNSGGTEGWRRWDRVLRRYQNTITQLQTALGGV